MTHLTRAILALGSLLVAACARKTTADYVIKGAVYTMATPGKAEAVAIKGDKIIFVGSSKEADRFVGDSTEMLDLGSRMILPGFRDTHVHLRDGLGLMAIKTIFVVGNSLRTLATNSLKSAATCSGVRFAARSLSPAYRTTVRGFCFSSKRGA